ncbi:unnamed protein product, partial [Polarella glacialis]
AAVEFEQQRHGLFHRLSASPGDEVVSGSVRRGDYVLRDASGDAVCGLRVLGAYPLRLACGAAWAAEGREAELAQLAETLRRRAGRLGCSLVADSRDERWLKLQGAAASNLGLWRRRQRLGIAVTGIPIGLQPEEQARLARAPFLVPWEFLPFHAGRVVLI